MNTAPSSRQALGAFLRSVREQRRPADFGLPVSGRRRTPGLRREEVAATSGVGLAWYTWLEQGRVDTSRQVLESLARTLRMDVHERRHILTLGGYAVGTEPGEQIVDELRPLLDSWPLTPALVLDHRFDVLAGNAAFAAVWPEPVLPVEPFDRPNFVVELATRPSLRAMLVTEDPVYELFLRFRRSADQFADDPGVERVLERLREGRPDLAHWWSCREVRESGTWPVVLRPLAAAVDAPLRWTFSLLNPGSVAGALLVQAPAEPATAEWIRERMRAGGLTDLG